MLVNGAQLPSSRLPSSLGFLAGVCNRNQVDYDLMDLSMELRYYFGDQQWEYFYKHSWSNLDVAIAEKQQEIDNFFLAITDRIKQSGADAIAISVFSYIQHQWCELFLRYCKKHNTNLPIIAGGSGVNTTYQLKGLNSDSYGRYLVDQDLLDYYVLGEGDIIFEKFITGHRNIAGLNSKNNVEHKQEQINDLDSLPFVDYKKLKDNLNDYLGPKGTPVITITGSRGCVQDCTFCDVAAHWKKYRFRTGKHIADEILQCYLDAGVTEFIFSDSLLNGSLSQFMEMLEVLDIHINNHPGLSKLSLNGNFILRPKTAHKERMFQLMSKVGLKTISVGLESGSEKVRIHMRKKFTNEDVDYHLAMCEKYGIQNSLLMIVGYVTETEQDFQESLELLKRWQRYVINDTVLIYDVRFTMAIQDHTPVEAMSQELGTRWFEGSNNVSDWVCDSNPELTVKERYLRWIRATRDAINMSYNLNGEIELYLEVNRTRAAAFTDVVKPLVKRIIPIQTSKADSALMV